MPLEKSAPLFNGVRKPETRQSILKVINKPYKKTYTNGINIQGEYLKKYGFGLGDTVAVEVSQNRILIERMIQE